MSSDVFSWDWMGSDWKRLGKMKSKDMMVFDYIRWDHIGLDQINSD